MPAKTSPCQSSYAYHILLQVNIRLNHVRKSLYMFASPHWILLRSTTINARNSILSITQKTMDDRESKENQEDVKNHGQLPKSLMCGVSNSSEKMRFPAEKSLKVAVTCRRRGCFFSSPKLFGPVSEEHVAKRLLVLLYVKHCLDNLPKGREVAATSEASFPFYSTRLWPGPPNKDNHFMCTGPEHQFIALEDCDGQLTLDMDHSTKSETYTDPTPTPECPSWHHLHE
ncbi:unnamed protein product [Victoria cruziana]